MVFTARLSPWRAPLPVQGACPQHEQHACVHACDACPMHRQPAALAGLAQVEVGEMLAEAWSMWSLFKKTPLAAISPGITGGGSWSPAAAQRGLLYTAAGSWPSAAHLSF